VLRIWIAGERGGREGIGLEHVETVRALAGCSSGRASLPGGTVVATVGRLRWEEGVPPSRPGTEVAQGRWRVTAREVPARRGGAPSRWRALFDAASLDAADLRIRKPRPGDRIRPLGLGGTKKLQDVFVDAKVPREERAAWPVVESGAILWLPGLVRSEHATVGPGTRRVLVVEAARRRIRARRLR
jgi:tRNA(Ile)-lysidine synthase